STTPPLLESARYEPVAKGAVAGDRSRRHQPHCRLEVLARDGDRFLHGLDAVVEPDARVPDGVPEGAGHITDVPSTPVNQDDVDVAARRELAAPIPADGDQGDVVAVAEQLGEPVVDQPGVGA